LVKKGKCTLGPDDEAAKVSTRSELEEVESLYVGELDSREVAECLYDAVVLVVDDERATALAVATVAHFSLSGAEFAGVGDLDDIGVCIDALQECYSFLCLLEGLDVGGEDEGNLGDLLDAVTAGENERGEGRGSEGRDGSEATLVLVYFDVPFAPDFGGGKHATAATHVTKRGLARTVCSTTTDTGDTGDGTTGTPGLGGCLMAGLFAHGVGLTLVLCDALMNLCDDIEPDRCGQHGGERERARGF